MSVTSQIEPTLRDGQHAPSPFHEVPILMSVGGWIPDSPDQLNEWLEKKLKELEDEPWTGPGTQKPEPSSIRKFRTFIEDNAEIYMGFHRLFDGVPKKDPQGKPQVGDYKTMLRLFQSFLHQAPEFDTNFLVFLPFTAVLQWPMAMANGLTILINPEVNFHFRQLFAVWSRFLASTDSRHVLTTNPKGWFSPAALNKMPKFDSTFICDPKASYWGFQSWDHFFARKLQAGARPVSSPANPAIITSACESEVLRIQHAVKKQDEFWIKGQPYSLTHMLNNHPDAHLFDGGTVYQAFLSPFFYHRWSSPVDGVVKSCEIVPGTYFAGMSSTQLPSPPEFAWQGQQPFLAHVASRALIFIEANDPKIGLMCFIGIGMVEVSSCEITVYEGQKVKKGDEIGTFHFGGSTHCLVFGPATKITFNVKPNNFVHVHTAIGTAN